jgi:D-beta-D-heptose 7-phosphate kinase / D-beta-D-heptose 1-phosphate adenosyltransferase
MKEFLQIIEQFPNKNVLVIGDAMLDVYINGASSRLSPEAPVPVVDVASTVRVPGGACNTAHSVRALGASVSLASVIGVDEDGGCLIAMLEKSGIDHSGVGLQSDRQTITKTRVTSEKHIHVRYDEGTAAQISSASEAKLIAYLESHFNSFDAIIVSDYDKGLFTPPLIRCLARLRRIYGKFIAIDSKRLSVFNIVMPSFVKPNYKEAIDLVRLPGQQQDRVNQLHASGDVLFAQTRAQIIAVTLDAEGALIFHGSRKFCEIAAPVVANPAVTGAGDTFISLFSLSYCCGANIAQAARIAIEGCAIVVQKDGTACCDYLELQSRFRLSYKYVDDYQALVSLCQSYRSLGKRIVFTNGCYDILHSGHVSSLHRAKALGDILIVGINNDDSIRRLKGNMRPINTLADRCDVLAGLAAVDHIVPFGASEDDTPCQLINIIKPEIFVKGGDYRRETLPEMSVVERHGGKLVIIPYVPDHSTTHIIERINNHEAQ